MREKICGIYKIENLVNGKVYIGQSRDIKNRWSGHMCYYNKNEPKPLYWAMKKYGIENFSFKIIKECKEEELDYFEIKFIRECNSYINYKNSNGYNLTIGGEHGILGYSFTEQQKEKLSKSHLGKKASKEAIERMREVSPHKKKVLCDGLVFKSTKEMSRHYGINYSNISRWLTGVRKMPQEWIDKGLRYAEEDVIYKEVGFKKVICDNIVFDSIEHFARYDKSFTGTTYRNWLKGLSAMRESYKERGLSYYQHEKY